MEPDVSSRLARFRAALADADLDGAVIARPENVYYLSGANPGHGRRGRADSNR